MKVAKALASITTLVLTGCATTMSPAQHDIFARDYALLNICSEQGLINQNIAAQGLQLYRGRLNNYKADLNLIDERANQYYQNRSSVNSSVCNRYAVKLRSEIIQNHQSQQDMQDFNAAMNGFSESMERSQDRSLETMKILNNGRNY